MDCIHKSFNFYMGFFAYFIGNVGRFLHWGKFVKELTKLQICKIYNNENY